MSRDTRHKASDVLHNTIFVFSQKTTFEKAFPQIDDVKIVVVRHGYCGVSEGNRESHYGKDVGEYVDCTNPMCYGGGVSVGSLLQKAVAAKQTHIESSFTPCRGYEGSPGGKRRYRTCTNGFEVVIDITYKDTTSSDV